MPDGTVETKNVISVSGAVVTLESALSTTPNVNTVWLIQNTAVLAQKFRVIDVQENDGINYTITALSYVDEKYAFIEENISLPDRTVSVLNLPSDPPNALTVSEKIVEINNQAVAKFIISRQPILGVTQYQVNYRFNNGNYTSQTVSRPDYEIFNTEAGTYEIQVFSYNAALEISATSTDTIFNAVGKTAVPGNVQNLTFEPVDSKNIRLNWDLSTDVDVIHGGRVYVRHSTLTNGNGTFTNAVDLIPGLAGNTTSAVVPCLLYTSDAADE